MAVDLTDVQQVVLTAQEEDAQGNPVQAAGQLSWSADVTGVVDLTPSTDSLSCTVAAVAMGTANVSVTDPANGLSATEQVTVTPGAATQMILTAGQPTG